MLHREQVTEGRAPGRFAAVSAISDVDPREGARLHRAAVAVHTVPNGVQARFLAPMLPPVSHRGVASWGNLDFVPNAQALHYYLHEVHLRRLASTGVQLSVVCSCPAQWLRALAARYSSIMLTGTSMTSGRS